MSFKEWKIHKLGDIAQIVMGQSPAGDTCNGVGTGVPLLNGPTEFKEYSPIAVQFTTDPKKISEVGDLLFCVRGSTTGRMNWSDKKYAIGRGLAAFRHKGGKQFQPYLKGLIDFYLNTILSQATGSTFPNVSSQQLLNLEVLIPDQAIQKVISSILSSLDEKIELNRQTNQTLGAIAQTLFNEICVPKEEELPKGWKIKKVSTVCEVNKNTLNKKNDFLEWINYIEISEVSRGIVGNIARYSVGEGPSRAKRKLTHGDTILSTVRPDRGSYFLSVDPLKNDIVSTGFAVFTPTKVPFSFLYLFLIDEANIKYYGHVANGGAYPAINPNVIMNMDIVIPNEKVLNKFHTIAEPILLKFYQNEKENKVLSSLRDSLLPKLMKGEIEIQDN